MMLNVFACLVLLQELCGAQVLFTMNKGFFVSSYQAGKDAMNITWTGAKGTVTLWLMDGDPDDLNPVARIASGLPTSTEYYVYTPPTSIANGNYTFEIDDTEGNSNWSKWFILTGGAAATASNTALQATPTPVTSASNTLSTPTPSPSASNTSTSQPSHGLSSGDKAAIGVGAVLGFVLILVLVWLAFWYGRRTAKKNEKSPPEVPPSPAIHQAVASPFPPSYSPETSREMSPELEMMEHRRVADLDTRASTIVSTDTGAPLSDEEKKELQRRRRAAELEGSVHTVVPGVVSERAELEARRKGANWETSVVSL